MKSELQVKIPVLKTNDGGTQYLRMSVRDCLIPNMVIAKLTNETLNDIQATIPNYTAVEVLQPNKNITVGNIGSEVKTFNVDVDKFTKVNVVVTVRDGIKAILVKVRIRGAVYLSQLTTSDGKVHTHTNRFDEEDKKPSLWRKSYSKVT